MVHELVRYMKSMNMHGKKIKVIVFLLHVSATLVTIVWEVHYEYKG